MVLRSDRRTGPAVADIGYPDTTGTTPGSNGFNGTNGAARSTGVTVADVGRLLSSERKHQGLSLLEAARRSGIPVDELRAAETGVLDGPDGLATLKTVRRYADTLGLPGDRFAQAILERWPTTGAVPRPFTPGRLVAAAPHRTPRPTAGNAYGHAGEPTQAVGHGPAHGSLQGVAASGWPYSDTGVTPAVLAPTGQVWQHSRRRAPGALVALVVVVAIAVVAGAALLAVDRLRPSWLQSIGLARAVPASAAPSSLRTPGTSGSAAGGSGTQPASGTAGLRPQTDADGTGAVFTVRASSFTTKLTAPGGPCWVQVTTNTSPTPAYAGVLVPGSSRTFARVRSLVVELGSSSGRVSVTSTGGRLAAYAPPGAPYTVTVRAKR